MSQTDRAPIAHSGGVPSTPAMRLLIVRDFATTVLGSEPTADHWMGQSDPAVLEGQCIVATACQTAQGYDDAMRELARIRQVRVDAPASQPGVIQPAGRDRAAPAQSRRSIR